MAHNIMLILGIFVLCSFYPFSAISFIKVRLPKKIAEYQRIRRALKEDKDPDYSDNFEQEIVINEYKMTDYILPVLIVTLFCVLGFYVLFNGSRPIILSGVSVPDIEHVDPLKLPYSKLSLIAIGMAILGSYVWSIQYIIRRLVTLDLSPGAYYSVGTRIIFATFISLILHHLIHTLEPNTKTLMLKLLPVLAFFTGIFPQRAMQYIQEKIMIFSKITKRSHVLPLDMIEGVTLFSKVRLSEVGIDNAQNLAEANIEELILKTPFNPILLTDWIAQAKLYEIFKDDLASLRKAGIRTVIDFIAAGENNALKPVAERSGLPENFLTSIYEIIKSRKDILFMINLHSN